MTKQQKQEIIGDLMSIYNGFVPTENNPILDMFGLISTYNATGKNAELIGGDWVVDNCPSPLKELE